MRGRVIRGNARTVTSVQCLPDQFAVQAQSLGVMTLTQSPGSAGRHSPGASPIGFVGDRGFGVNRWAGETTYPLQNWTGAAKPVADPLARRLGFGAGPAGQPGLPSTGEATGGLSSLQWLSSGQLNRPGLH